jgi:6-pyruvoyltetrahydropterin/6-carboxytetrahydropterin synthase
MKVTKIFTFDAAHKLQFYDGPCHNLHGHTYHLEVTCKSNILTNGMLIDFAVLKQIVTEKIISKVDHAYLNDVFPFEPTAEKMADWILKELQPVIPVYSIRLYETPTSFAEVSLDE